MAFHKLSDHKSKDKAINKQTVSWIISVSAKQYGVVNKIDYILYILYKCFKFLL